MNSNGREEKPRDLASHCCCFFGLYFCNLKENSLPSAPNFPYSIDSRAVSSLLHSSPQNLGQSLAGHSCPERVCVTHTGQHGSIPHHRSHMSQQRERMCVLSHPSTFQSVHITERGHWCIVKRETEYINLLYWLWPVWKIVI